MVLPTDHHWALRGWLRLLHGIEASELAGVLVLGNLDGLLRLSGATHRLRPEEHVLLTTARSRADDDRAKWQTDGADGDASSDALRDRVERVLAEVCQALHAAGVPASPFHGMGALSGDEVFDALVRLDDPARLYEVMRAEGFDAEPDPDAPPLRERAWPEP